tara:strand:+ start:209 stop:796 length:588 start_codon:yes stop_codon:yes gene_type:complete
VVNQIPAILNTNPPEPKSNEAELTVKLDILSVVPSNKFGNEQYEIEAKAEEIDKYYSKKYWIPVGMGKPEINKSYSAEMRRRRLGQTREGVIKEGKNADGSLIRHNWDWEIMSFSELNSNTQPTPNIEENQMTTPMVTDTIASKATKDEQIARAVALKAAVDVEVAKLNNKLADGSTSLADIFENSDNFFNYLTQ